MEEVRETFLVELASFELLLKKSRMVCEGERRQVEEYRGDSARIGMCSFRTHISFWNAALYVSEIN